MPAVRAALKELYVLKSIVYRYCVILMLIYYYSLEPLIC